MLIYTQRKIRTLLRFTVCLISLFATTFVSAEGVSGSASWRSVQGSPCILIQEKSVVSDVSHQPICYWKFQNVCEEPVTFSYHLVVTSVRGWNTVIKSTKTSPLMIHLEASESQKGDDGAFGQFAPGTGIQFMRVFVHIGPKTVTPPKSPLSKPERVKPRTPDSDVAATAVGSAGSLVTSDASLPEPKKKALPFCRTYATVLLETCQCLPRDEMTPFRDEGKGICFPKLSFQKDAVLNLQKGIPSDLGEPYGPPLPEPPSKSPIKTRCDPSITSCTKP